ncbi:MAG: hypothetical protein RIR00_2545 [Pseudomonadota bacterium]|jgi:aryl-alcohol dehydrogenase-like predicted oxidoreductase
MRYVQLGHSDLRVSHVCLGTMTFGEQNSEAEAHAQLDQARAAGVNFIDTAELYPVMPRASTCGASERIIGNWLAAAPGRRQQVVLATKVAGPARGMTWIRKGAPDVSPADIIAACEGSLRRLQTDYIDLYQLHWPNRKLPIFGQLYFQPEGEFPTSSIEAQLRALDQLVRDGKVRHIGVSNESAYGVGEFIRLAEHAGLTRIVSVQNGYNLLNRSVENGLDEALHRHGVALLAYSPLAFGRLCMKYDAGPAMGQATPPRGRLEVFPPQWSPRYMRPLIGAAARRYAELAADHGLTPTALALAYCYANPKVASTLIGATTPQQLAENLAVAQAAPELGAELLAAIDAIRWEFRDPAQ